MNALRLSVFVLVVAATATAVAQGPSGAGYTPVAESECWGCHGPGNWTPDMDPVVAFATDPVALRAGETTDVSLQVFNAWVIPSGDFQLSGFVANLDLSEAQSLRALSDRPEEHFGPVQGTIPFDPTGPAQRLHPEWYISLLTEPQSGSVSIDIPDGATELLLTVSPEGPGEVGAPDLAVAVYPGMDEPAGFPAIEVDDAGPGAAEVIHLSGSDAISDLGYGDWAIEVSTRILDAGDAEAAVADGDIGFTVELHAWFNATEDALAVREDTVPSGASTALTWRMVVLDEPAGDEVLRGTLRVTGHYEHIGPEPDEAGYEVAFEVPLVQTENGVTWGTQSTVVLEEPPFISMAVLSEIIGYIAGTLVLVSLWTGGIFGKASRRRQNRIFGTAKRRIAFHNFLSYGILLFAVIHLIMFVVEVNYHWALGLIWGGLGALAMLGLGVTGAMQVPMIRRWDHAIWKWTHFGLAIATVVFSIVHILLDGTHFGDLQESLGWVDPLVPEGRQ